MVKNMSIDVDGIVMKQEFLPRAVADKLNAELEPLFQKRSVNGSNGFIQVGKGYRKICMPLVAVNSINLAELSLKVLDEVAGQLHGTRKDYHLTNLEIFEEINPTPLFWHTDNRNGMVRAFVYIEGGSLDTGALKFMLGTHKRDYYVEHKLSEEQIKQLSDKIFVADGKPGDLVIVDTVGFHANCPRSRRRRIMVFEYQLRQIKDVEGQSRVYLATSNLSDEVVSNIDVFRNRARESRFLHGTDYDFLAQNDDHRLEFLYRFGRDMLRYVNKVERLFVKRRPRNLPMGNAN